MLKIKLATFTKEKVSEHIEKKMKEFEATSSIPSIIKKVATWDYILVKLTIDLAIALKDYDNAIQAELGLPYAPINKYMTEINVLTGERFFKYEFKYENSVNGNVDFFLEIKLSGKNVDPFWSGTLLGDKFLLMIEPFAKFIEEENSKEGIYTRFVNELFDSVQEAMETHMEVLSKDGVTEEEYVNEIRFAITGAYYSLLK